MAEIPGMGYDPAGRETVQDGDFHDPAVPPRITPPQGPLGAPSLPPRSLSLSRPRSFSIQAPTDRAGPLLLWHGGAPLNAER